MKNILFIHQSAELYGSDKTLLLLLKHMDKSQFHPVVVLPFPGPLKIELEKENIEVIIAPVLKLYRKMFTPKNILLFFKDIKTSISILDKLDQKYHFEIIYSNTLAVLLGIIYAKKRTIKHIWHVHEIIESPRVFTKLFCFLLQLKANTKIIYNSIATQKFWNVNKAITYKSQVIWNGIETDFEPISAAEKRQIRHDLFNADQEVVIALVGRISRWKGQLVLLNSFKKLTEINNNIKLVFIGSAPPNQEVFLDILKKSVSDFKLENKVSIIPFQNNISEIWESIDIAVVPSTEPEPFGLVAIEAMLKKKPVIASNHGGLTETVIHNETGFLVEPQNEKELAEQLQKLINNPDLRSTLGENGHQRVLKEFSTDKYTNSFNKLFSEM